MLKHHYILAAYDQIMDLVLTHMKKKDIDNGKKKNCSEHINK